MENWKTKQQGLTQQAKKEGSFLDMPDKNSQENSEIREEFSPFGVKHKAVLMPSLMRNILPDDVSGKKEGDGDEKDCKEGDGDSS